MHLQSKYEMLSAKRPNQLDLSVQSGVSRVGTATVQVLGPRSIPQKAACS